MAIVSRSLDAPTEDIRDATGPPCTSRRPAYDLGDDESEATDPRAALRRRADAPPGGGRRGDPAPGQMTYGSQAAAASQVFEQQRDLALRDRATGPPRPGRRRARRGSTTARSGRACGADDRSPPERLEALPVGGPLHRLPANRRARRMTETVEATATDERRSSSPSSASGRGRDARWGRRSDAARAVRAAERRANSSRRRRLQPIGAFKIRGAYDAVASLTADERAAASSPTRPATTPRAWRGPPACWARRRSSSCRRDAPAIKRERVAADGAEIVIVGHRERRAAGGRRTDRRRARPGDHPALRRRPDHRRARERSGWRSPRTLPDVAAVLVPIGGGGLASGVAVAVRALRPGRAGHRRRAGAGGGRAGVARGRPDRRAGRPSDVAGRSPTGRGPRRSAQRTFAHLSRLLDGIVTVLRGGDRRRRPARGGGEPARRRAVGRAGRRGPRVSRARGRARSARRRAGRRGRQRRQRRPGAVPASYLARAAPAEGLTSAPVPLARPAVPPAASPALRIAARSTSAARSVRAVSRSSWPHPAGDDARIAARKTRSPTSHMIPPASCWSASGVGPHGRIQRRVVRVERQPAQQDGDRQERVLRHLEEDVERPRRVRSSARAPDRARRPATRTAGRRRGRARARGRGRAGSRAPGRTAARSGCPT